MEPPNLCLVTEYLSNGSLEDVLTRMNAKEGALSKKFSLKRIISLAKDIARGLNWLHHKGIIHRDLKVTHAHRTARSHTFHTAQVCAGRPPRTQRPLTRPRRLLVICFGTLVLWQSANILLDANGKAKICDLSAANNNTARVS